MHIHYSASFCFAQRSPGNKKNQFLLQILQFQGFLGIYIGRPVPAESAINVTVCVVAMQARLKAHIHGPNSPELVHFLFTPLSLIIEASRDPKLSTDLPTSIISPLLTSSAVALLHNCLTSKEMELWSSLGDAWTTSRLLTYLLYSLSDLLQHA